MVPELFVSRKMVMQKMNRLPKKLGLIAGSGDLPEKIIEACLEQGREIFVVFLDSNVEPSKYLEQIPHVTVNVGAVGKALKFLKKNDVEELVLVGGLKRPKISSIRPDGSGLRLLARITSARLSGDNSLLSIVLGFLEEAGLKIIGIDEILENLLVPMGILGGVEPSKSAREDIVRGMDVAKKLGEMDIGQSVVVQRNSILGVEAIEGTDALLARCEKLKLDGEGGVLVKVKKPNQDNRIDLPTIGVETIKNAAKAGLVGIAVEAGSTLIVDQEKLVKKADKLGIFVIGV